MSATDIKIAYFIDRLIRGGSELQLVEQISRLHLKGIEQELFCLYKSREHEQLCVPCKVKFLNIRKLISFNCLTKIYRLVSYLRGQNFSIVQTYFFDSTMVGVLAAKLAGGIKIISCRRDLGFWYTPKLLLCLKLYNKIVDRILVNSDAVKQSVMEKEGVDINHIDIIPNGIDISQFDYSREEREKSRSEFNLKRGEVCVGMITNMSRRVKRTDIFIKAAWLVLRKKDNFRFLVLGEGMLRNELIAMARDLGIEERITFLDREISKHNVLSAMDIGVLTSDSEGLSNAIMEYMAAGLPVVATRVGGNINLVGDGKTGYLTPAGDFRALGAKIWELGNDVKKRFEYGKNGRTYIINYDWDKIVDRILKYYEVQITR